VECSELLQLPTLELAQALIGWELIRETPRGVTAGVITETEAYLADDPANHAYKGKTVRNAAMFAASGYTYVYFTYGLHYCLNIVSGPEGVGEAVLIRSLQPTQGIPLMQKRRGNVPEHRLCTGPANLCKALGIDQSLSEHYILEPPLYLSRKQKENLPIETSVRIGISQGTTLLYRFFVNTKAS